MNDPCKKDALTELVDSAGSPSGDSPNNGTVSTPSGDRVELAYEFGKVTAAISDFFKAIENYSTLEQKIIQEDLERKLKALGQKKTK